MLDQVLKIFSIVPDYNLNIMQDEQNLFEVTNRIISGLKPIILNESPDIVIVQGDTTTTFAASLAAYYCKVKVAHIEAGLRTSDKYNPFPEEINRRLTSVIADIHFAPTEEARYNLLNEGINDSNIFVTGNTVVDALKLIIQRWENGITDGIQHVIKLLHSILHSEKQRLLLVTCHRRESFGEDIRNICYALKEIAQNDPDVVVVYPVHLNPNVKIPVYRTLDGIKNIHLIDPLDYEGFLFLLSKAYLVLTDSGGVQEEAPSLGKPVLVMRKKTERPEGINYGMAKLVGTSSDEIVTLTRQILADNSLYQSMIPSKNPYGDGNASEKIIRVLEELL